MTPQDLTKAWPDGVPGHGRLTLTLAPQAAAAPAFVELLHERLTGIAGSLSTAFALIESGFQLTLTPQPFQGTHWPIEFAFSQPATDVMAYFLTALESVGDEAGGGLFTCVDITTSPGADMLNRTLLPAVPVPPFRDETRAVLSPDAARRMLTASVFAVLPGTIALDRDKALDAMIALSALVEDGCFGAIEIENDLSSPLVGQSADGAELHLGVTGYRGDPSAAQALIGFVAHLVGQSPPPDPMIVLAHEALL